MFVGKVNQEEVIYLSLRVDVEQGKVQSLGYLPLERCTKGLICDTLEA